MIDVSYKETWLHKVNPTLKFLIIILLAITMLFIHNINLAINFSIFLFLVYFLSTGQPYNRLIIFIIPFIILFISSSTSMILFGKGGNTWFEYGLIQISAESFYRGLHIGFRGLIFGLLGIIFTLTTRPVLFFYSLMQQLKLSPKYAYSFMAAIRMLPIVLEEIQTLSYAFKIRGRNESKFNLYKTIKLYSIPILSQSIRRAHRIAIAMETKKFSNRKNRTYYYKIGFSRYDLLYLLLIIIMFSFIFLISTNYPYTQFNDIRFI